jgi:hypothetical protein
LKLKKTTRTRRISRKIVADETLVFPVSNRSLRLHNLRHLRQADTASQPFRVDILSPILKEQK